MMKSFFFLFLLFTLHIVNIVTIPQPNPSRRKGELSETVNKETWQGKWFPINPLNKQTKPAQQEIHTVDENCDDGVHGIEIDFLPNSQQQHGNYLCLTSNRTVYAPKLSTESIMTDFYIPPAYAPHSVCLNVSLKYETNIPTYGAFRPLPPKYGDYKYLPSQRWLHSLAEGSIVMLYHPCADVTQLEKLQDLVRACLYRHIITPFIYLHPEHPFALLAWGKLLQMSVVDQHIVTEFIKEHAYKAPLSSTIKNGKQIKQYYDKLLTNEAHLVTDLNDSQLCPFDIQEM